MSSPEQASPQLRLTILLVVVLCLFGALFARLWFLQVMDAPKAQAAAANNGIRLVYAPAPRGVIEDRNGNVLVGNVNEPVIEVSRLIASQNPAMVTRLAALLGMTVPQLQKAINNLQYSPYAPVPVMPDAAPAADPLRPGEPDSLSRACRPRPCRSAPTAPWARPQPTSSATWARSARPSTST